MYRETHREIYTCGDTYRDIYALGDIFAWGDTYAQGDTYTWGDTCMEGHLQGMHAQGCLHRDTHGDAHTGIPTGIHAQRKHTGKICMGKQICMGDIHTGGYMPERTNMHRGTKTYGGNI
jgi:hypothetical protein